MSSAKCPRIPLEDIKKATKNFGGNNFISKGGFGNVFKGEFTHSGRKEMVAVKRLDKKLDQGNVEFQQEIDILSLYKHDNLVSLRGVCDEAGENILVYEYLPNKSLDLHLNSPDLTWIGRLYVCLGAARGLKHLHNPLPKTMQLVVHRDIKSGNILLDTHLNAKISDFGLSRYVSANKEFSRVNSHPVGTGGYCDPLYYDKGILRKESDIYSFGVVLFEVLCGRRAIENNYNDNRRVLSELAQRCYEEKKIGTIVLDCLQEQISPYCLDKFAKLAYQCLRGDHKERPSIAKIVKELKAILRYQITCTSWKDKKLNSHTLFHLIENPRMRTCLESQWSDVKTSFSSFLQEDK